MVGAHEVLGVAVVGADHPVAPVAAHVQEDVKLVLGVVGDDDGVLAHVRQKEVVGIGDETRVGQHEPGATENFLQLVLINRLVTEDAPV